MREMLESKKQHSETFAEIRAEIARLQQEHVTDLERKSWEVAYKAQKRKETEAKRRLAGLLNEERSRKSTKQQLEESGSILCRIF